MVDELFHSFPSKGRKRSLNVLPENPDESDSESLEIGRFPRWLHRKMPAGNSLWKTGSILNENRLPTVCEEAKCPNLLECWSKKTATFLAMGKQCTRNCGFCSIDFAKKPAPLEEDEPHRIAESVKQLGLKHVVITMVARDDLPDGGAHHLGGIIKEIRRKNETTTIEVLTSDLQGNEQALEILLQARPDVFNHNIETVRALTPRVRHVATYDRTLSVLQFVKEKGGVIKVKSGFMVGLGETEEEIKETIKDLKAVGCEIITIGQYLQPNRQKLRVKRFVTPEEFEAYAAYGFSIGVRQMFSGPFVRSSYHAGEVFNTLRKNEKI